MNVRSDQVAAVRRFSRFYTQRLGLLADVILDSEFTLSQARVLYELAHGEVVAVTEIAARLDLDPGYVSRIVRGLERRGFVAKERSDVDRRRVLVRLTDAGQAQFSRLDDGSRHQITTLLAELDPRRRDEVIMSMRAIEGALGGPPAGSPERVTYRSHRPGDMGWIVQRHGELYHGSHGWDETFEAMVSRIVADFVEGFDPAWERCWIAEVEGVRAGSVALVRRSKTVGQLRLLLVEPWARGRGIGARLVSECVGQARHVGYRKMVLFTVRGLDPARRLYEAEGFDLVSEHPTEAWGRTQVEQTWELKL
jgi:DNA-binding MarR family transcriptional regulator/N-acetylglutamate synthase-like GNAT family acetyltransferase